MGGLIFSELKKFLFKKSVIVILILTSIPILFVYGYLTNSCPKSICNIAKNKFFQTMNGTLTKDKYDLLVSQFNETKAKLASAPAGTPVKGIYNSDANVDLQTLSTALSEANYIMVDAKNRAVIVDNAKKNIAEDNSLNDQDYNYDIRFNQLAINMYSNQGDLVITNQNNMPDYSGDNLYALIILIVVLLCIYPIFSSEHKSGMYMLIFSSKHGRGKVFLSKVIATIIISTVITLFFEAMIFACFVFTVHPIGFTNLLRNSQMFYNTPYNFTFLEYIFVRIGFHLIAVIFFSLFIMLLSACFKKNILSMASGMVLFLITYGLDFYLINFSSVVNLLGFKKMLDSLKTYLYASLFNVDDYFSSFKVVRAFNLPFLQSVFVIVYTLILSVILVIITYLIYNRTFKTRRMYDKGLNYYIKKHIPLHTLKLGGQNDNRT